MYELVKSFILWGFGILFILFLIIFVYCCFIISHECEEKEEKHGKS